LSSRKSKSEPENEQMNVKESKIKKILKDGKTSRGIEPSMRHEFYDTGSFAKLKLEDWRGKLWIKIKQLAKSVGPS
jgi:hypothetical protein